jgi:hypothetical protein
MVEQPFGWLRPILRLGGGYERAAQSATDWMRVAMMQSSSTDWHDLDGSLGCRTGAQGLAWPQTAPPGNWRQGEMPS